ncbi:P-loop containing nucleoside triphosphate hydrolase protein [Mycena rebaudengoi]|nr:P-loop containing nucleoside triphosphate hydrolase protein [Mycena rebaudengoi]
MAFVLGPLSNLFANFGLYSEPQPLPPPRFCKCVDLCGICGYTYGEERVPSTKPRPATFRSYPPLSLNTSAPRARPAWPAEEAVHDLNEKLTVSLSLKIPDNPVLFCRNGALACFSNGLPLHEYQAVDLQRICDREGEQVATGKGSGYILAYDMGLGKTVTMVALSAISSKFPYLILYHSVIAPSVGILQHWKSEFLKFVGPNMKILLYHGNDRNKQDPTSFEVVLTTVAEVRNQYAAFNDEKNLNVPHKYPFYTGRFHRVIIDEAHTIRNPDSASAAACLALQKVHSVLLTGTPAQATTFINKLRDLAPLLDFIGVTSHGLGDLETFDRVITEPYGRGEVERPIKLLVEVLAGCMIYRPKESVKGAFQPPRRHKDVVLCIELTPAERAVYRYIQFSHHFKSRWAKMIRLRQAADHPTLLTKALHRGDVGPKPDETSDQMRFQLDDSDADANQVIAQDKKLDTMELPPCLKEHAAVFKSDYMSSKLIAVQRLVKGLPRGEKIMIFTHFVTTLDIIAEMLSRSGLEYTKYDGRMESGARERALNRIKKEEECTILLVSIMAGGTGLDIPACNHVVLMEPWWNPYVEDQAISRAHRIGQKRDVRVYKLIVEDSIEDSIVKTQDAKREVIGSLLSLCAVPDVDEMQQWLSA